MASNNKSLVTIVAVEEEDSEPEDVIPPGVKSNHKKNGNNTMDDSRSRHSLSSTEHTVVKNRFLDMPADDFAEGCKLLQAAALGNKAKMEAILLSSRTNVDFRDYDRRTALHVAASEGHLHICKFLLTERGAKINRSDRWGGSALDDASRHRHKQVIAYLRSLGARPGSASKATNYIKAAADGDINEVEMLLMLGEFDVNESDYDKRTALHLAAGEGNADIVELLCKNNANVNIEDRWNNRPLDDAERGDRKECINTLLRFGAKNGFRKEDIGDSITRRREISNFKVTFDELEMIDKIGKGSFGEIYRCRWRDIMVAAKCIRSAKVQKEWAIKQVLNQLKEGADVDDIINEMDEADIPDLDKQKALSDFRQEISILKSLRHPNIVLLLAYSTTADLEVMISELMKCSLLDVFKAHIINGTKMKRKDKIAYASQLAQGMQYLHTCKPAIIHRDLKPANLLIDQSGVLKVADFGLSKVRQDPKQNEKETFMMTGETGSYRFMAPEIFRHSCYNETVDVYSFGMILFFLLSGKPPWPNDNGIVAARKASDEGDRPTIPRSWDNPLQILLQNCWDENPSSRPSFHQILQILRQYTRTVFPLESENFLATSPIDQDKGCMCIIM